jgi:hypothetical protein
MKVLSLFWLTALPLTLGFSSSSIKARSSTAVSMAASSFPKPPQHGWEGKPVTHKGEKTTKPVAAKNASSWLERKTMGDVMLEPSYALTWAVAALCPLIIWYHPSYAESGPSLIGIAGGCFHLLFAALLWVQTRRVRCVFEKDAFEFYNIKGPHLDLDKGAWLQEKPANYVAGTPNRWKYDKIINYGFFPSLEFPVICYFKETETPVEQWNKWFAAFDSYGLGQPHFFPGIVDVHEFKRQMELRGAKQKPIPTLKTIKKQQQKQEQKKK